MSIRFRRHVPRVLLWAALLPAVVLLFTAQAAPAAAQGANPLQRSYVTPFPSGDRYRVVVLGDSLGDGIWSGLYRAFEEDKNVEVVKRSKVSTGFTRPERYDWNAEIEQILKDEKYQIAVVTFGANEGAIKSGKDVLKVGSEGWREAYGERVEAFIKKLRAAKLAVYWVGLPVMRSPNQSSDAEALNEVFREKAFINGAKFIDSWTGFTDESGRYSAYGPDMTGQVRRLREDDGVHFTMRGYLKLAHFAEKEIRRDLNLAKLERNIPLAGGEDEQAKVMGREVAPAKVPMAQLKPSAEVVTEDESGAQTPKLPTAQAGEVDVLRPDLSDQSLQAAQTLSTPGVAGAMPESEMITADINGELTALASISSVSDPSLASSKPRLPLAQRPYYRVLIKGEQLEPKDGRADDFSWPRE